MAFIAVYDSNVLYPSLLRDILIRLAQRGLVQANGRRIRRWDIEAKHPDDFLIDQFHLDAIAVHSIVQQISDDTVNPPLSFSDVLDGLERLGVPQIAALLRR